MRFLHTADWQIGKSFRFADDDTQAVLRAERLEAIQRIGRLAEQHDACAVLVAGDLFDVGNISTGTLLKPIERMRQFPLVRWHLIPGNHDAHFANGPWDRLQRQGLPDNVCVHVTPQPIPLVDERAWVLPAVLTQRHMAIDPTEWMNAAQTPPGALRIGLAHGSVREFGSTPSSTNNLIAIDRAAQAKLDYLALGDWHGVNKIDERTWYAGTPEPDGFDLGGGGGGQILLVELDGDGSPRVQPLATGRFCWINETAAVRSAEDVLLLESRLRALNSDLSSVLLRLRVEGTVDLGVREAFEQKIRLGVGSALRYLRLNADCLYLQPTAQDLEAIDHAGFVRTAADRLAQQAESEPDEQRVLAAEALQRLFELHLRQNVEAP